MGIFIGFSQRVDYDYTWTTWPAEKGRLVNVFLGIPYAALPIDDLRFRRPKPAYLNTRYPWFAKSYRPCCIQSSKMIQNMDEDCLYLNIFYPNRTNDPLTTRYPVIIFIHGGDYNSGCSRFYPGHALASQGAVVITFNFRLGPLGFLATGDFASPGNYGLWDHIFVFEWVKKYIEWFRGDKDRITLLGHGSGAASIGVHIVSPLTRGRIAK
ncbi:unnamed protein product [Protopolystoma xenopodis]|uniref:Carboxylesterase type B domain-containing protein n=1 Tax=Protopolystoma xenopodis TaxID=117903 RepID=A0A448WJN5_9PLAT|nr:unnamed protein product [Protopolystoma xenopodis]